MSLPGKVTAVAEKTATVSVVPSTECKGCHACSGLAGEDSKATIREIQAIKGDISVEVGDEVLLDLNPGEGSIAALLVFGFPMAAFFAGLFLAPAISSLIGVELSDILRIITGFSAMALAFVILAIFSRSRHAEKLSMKIVKKLDKSDTDKIKACQLNANTTGNKSSAI